MPYKIKFKKRYKKQKTHAKKRRAEYKKWFEDTHDKAHGIGKYSKKRKK